MRADAPTPEAMSAFLNELVNAWNSHDLDRVTTFYAPDYEGIDVGQPQVQHGPAGVREALASYLRAFPDLHFTGENAVIQGGQAALTWTAHATHLGPLLNIPATGRKVEVRGVSVLTVEDDQVKHGLYIWDLAGLLRKIGLLPEL